MTSSRDIPRIIIVDDEPFVLRLLATMLSQLGYAQVTACETGEQALRELMRRSSPIDLIFLDINMPGMDGVELIRRLVEFHYAGHVVTVSGEDGRMLEGVNRLLDAHRLKSLGALRKPVSRIQLATIMAQLSAESLQHRPRPASAVFLGIEELRNALSEGKITNFYQPQFSLMSGDLIGAEALVRLHDASGQLVFPDRFIGLAEEHGLICEITRCVLKAAMRQAKIWRAAGQRLSVAVNVSMNDLSALDFPDMAASMAEVIGVEPSAITLEVTERQVVRQLSTVLDVLSRLRLKRFRLSIDDFGTGHASLAQLRDLPFDELKIDRGFVHGAAADPTLRAICDASLRMAKQLGMQTVAEGIEVDDDRKLLGHMGCDIAQGYLYARPLSVADMTELVRSAAMHADSLPKRG